MSKDIRVIRKECCDIWNKLKDKTKMIDYLIESKLEIADLEAKLAESVNKLNQYPYKNEVIEEQYEELKDGIKFRIENNITDDWEQLYHCVDVLCEKHKARIRDIENSICSIDQLKHQLTEKDKAIENWETMYRSVIQSCHNGIEEDKRLEQQLAEKEQTANNWQSMYNSVMKTCANDYKEILRLREELAEKEKEIEKVKEVNLDVVKKQIEFYKDQDKISFAVEQLEKASQEFSMRVGITDNNMDLLNEIIDNQIKQLKEMK